MRTQIITKQYIQENLIKQNGHLNGMKIKKILKTPMEIFMVFYNINKIPKCECGNEVSFKSFTSGFYQFCSTKCVANNKLIKEDKKQTKIEKYGNENYNNSEKRKLTCLEKYGVENPSQANVIKEKKIQTCLNRYGVKYSTQSKRYKQTMIKKYGGENPMYIDIIKETRKKSCLEKYGVENIMQTGLFGNPGYKYKDYKYPSGKVVKIQGYEPQLLDELLENYNENEILTDKKYMPEFWYFTNDNKKHRYFPDVYIPKENTIYEVKSSYTLEQSKKNRIFELKRQSVLDKGFDFILKVYR